MPLDPQAAAFIQAGIAAGFVPTSSLSPEGAREQMNRRRAMSTIPPPEVAHVEDRTIPGPAGDIPVRLYRGSNDSTLPLLVYFHGGGWVIGDLDSHDAACRAYASGANCAVLSIDYRLAPEHRYPAAAEDCYAALVWAAAHGEALGADTTRIALSGDSAGGNMTIAVSLMARDRGGPRVLLQVPIYPVADHDFTTSSYQQCAEGYGMGAADMRWFWDHYVPDVSRRNEAYASPLRAESLKGLPPALVITAEYDVLRDEGEAYARRLQQAGVPTTLRRYKGMIHGFVGQFAVMDQGRVAVNQIVSALKFAFGTS
jgi:acetyl esterase